MEEEYFYTLKFADLTPEHFVGEWEVAVLNRPPGAGEIGLPLVARDYFHADGSFAAVTDKRHEGTWCVIRDELLQRPYLAIDLGTTPVKALITRFQQSSSATAAQLHLYLLDGTELVLDKGGPVSPSPPTSPTR